MKGVAGLILITVTVSCMSDSGKLDEQVKLDFLNEFFEIVEENSIMTDSVDIGEIKTWAFNEAKFADSMEDCYSVVQKVFFKMGDKHSVFLSPYMVSYFYIENKNDRMITDTITFEGLILSDSSRYIKMKGFLAGTNEGILAYADSLQSLIRFLDSENCKGWILDLRENDGGDFSAMQLAIGPLLGNDTCIYLQDNKGRREAWFYSNGHIVMDTFKSERLVNSYELIHKNKPIAILTSNNTASAGEGLVVAFRGKENVKIFGQMTSGLSTGCRIYQMKNGSIINLANTVFVDRNGTVYGGKIQPDRLINSKYNKMSIQEDSVIIYAQQWIDTY